MQPTCKRWEIMSYYLEGWGSIYISNLELFCISSFSHPQFNIYSIICLYKYGILDIYPLGYRYREDKFSISFNHVKYILRIYTVFYFKGTLQILLPLKKFYFKVNSKSDGSITTKYRFNLQSRDLE